VPLNSAGRLAGAHLQLVHPPPSLWPAACRRGLLLAAASAAHLTWRAAVPMLAVAASIVLGLLPFSPVHHSRPSPFPPRVHTSA
jgi:hypothetical protein